MSALTKILDQIKDEALISTKTELKALLNAAKSDSHDFVKENAKKVETWLVMLAKGELDKQEFDALIEARKRIISQFLNTLEIQARARLEKITMGLIDLAIDKFIPVLIK